MSLSNEIFNAILETLKNHPRPHRYIAEAHEETARPLVKRLVELASESQMLVKENGRITRELEAGREKVKIAENVFNDNMHLKTTICELKRKVEIAESNYDNAARDRTHLRHALDERDARISKLAGEVSKLRVDLRDYVASNVSLARNEEVVVRQRDAAEAEAKALKEELDLLNRNYAKALALRDEQIDALNSNHTKAMRFRDKQIMDARENRFWQLVIDGCTSPENAARVIREAEEVLKGLHKA